MSHTAFFRPARMTDIRRLARPVGALTLALSCAATLVPGAISSTASAAPAAASVSAATNNVTANGGSYALTGTNVVRLANQLVQYTRTSSQTSTPTNIYGAEVIVVGGKVTAINDRLVTGGGATAIPAGAVVLSGHGAARDWLVTYARVGSAISIGGTAPAPVTPAPTTPAPTAPVGTAETKATSADGATFALSGTNVSRLADQLVKYTRTASQTVTPTNIWGAEVVVVGGKVTAVYDRISTGGGAVAIPANGYVLSGHNVARDWLMSHARVGTAITLGGGTASPTTPAPTTPAPTTPAPTTPAPTTPAPAPVNNGKALPDKIVGAYINMYQGPATAELPDYNVLFAAFALGGGGQNMHFITPVKESVASYKAEIKKDQARGAKWLLSIGGGVPSNEQTFIQNASQANTVFNKLVPIIDEYGFNGLDYDLENGPSGFSQDGLLTLSRKLKAKYGSSFAITMTPRPYEDFYFAIAAAHEREGLLDALQMQFYDAMETRNDAFLTSWIPSRLAAAKAAGVPYNKMVVGCITWPGYSYGWNDAATYGSIIRSQMASKGIRGAMVWDTAQEKSSGYSFWNMAKNL